MFGTPSAAFQASGGRRTIDRFSAAEAARAVRFLSECAVHFAARCARKAASQRAKTPQRRHYPQYRSSHLCTVWSGFRALAAARVRVMDPRMLALPAERSASPAGACVGQPAGSGILHEVRPRSANVQRTPGQTRASTPSSRSPDPAAHGVFTTETGRPAS